jgi:hypothetical protein
MAGVITVSNAKYRLDAETSAASTLAAELDVNQHSGLSDGHTVGQSGSEEDIELSNSENGFLAPGEGAQGAIRYTGDESPEDDDEGGGASSGDVTGLESGPLPLLALYQLSSLLQDKDRGGTDPRHGGHFSNYEVYAILGATNGDEMWRYYFHGAESAWGYHSHSVIAPDI